MYEFMRDRFKAICNMQDNSVKNLKNDALIGNNATNLIKKTEMNQNQLQVNL